MKYKKTTLKNGLRVITAPMKETQTATIIVTVDVGSRYEKNSEAGISHFLEHMVFKGTEKRPTYLEISEELDSIGGTFNAFTGEDRTSYYAKADSRHLDTAVDVISDIFLNSKMDSDEIDKEKGTIIQEINMYEDNPMSDVHNVFSELLYKNNPLGRKVIGKKETVSSFKRKNFIDYMDRFYLANDTIVSVAGKFDEKKTIKNISHIFSSMKRGRKPKFTKVNDKQPKQDLKIKFKKTDQTHLVIGNRAYHENHKDRFALGLLATILGGNMSSRLFVEVREKKGLAYYVRTFTDSFQDCGYLATQAGVEHGKLEETIATIAGEYKKITDSKIKEKELKKAKDYIKGMTVMGLESSDEVAMFLGDQELRRKKILLPKELFKKIDKVTPEDILRVAKDVFRNNTLNLAIIGPHKNENKLKSLMKI